MTEYRHLKDKTREKRWYTCLVTIRKKYEMTQAQVAKEIGVPQPQVSRFERGGMVKVDFLVRYIGALDRILEDKNVKVDMDIPFIEDLVVKPTVVSNDLDDIPM